MRIFSFAPSAGRPLTEFGSHHTTISSVAHSGTGTHVVCMHIDAGGVIGRHPTSTPQLFLVVAGAGWVSGGDGLKASIEAGQAALWDEGESHESGSESGMTAIVIQPVSLRALMPEVEPS